MNLRLLSGAICTLSLVPTSDSKANENGHEHAHQHQGHDHHHDHKFELGVAPGLVFLVAEREVVFGLHVHSLVALGKSPWAVGIGYERLFGEESHDTFSGVLQYRFAEHWSVALSPGVTLEGSELHPSMHLEGAYEHDFGRFHLGPSLEVAADPDDVHITLGLHIGVGL